MTTLTGPWRIAVDVGGTFTDLVLVDAVGELALVKVPSSRADPTEGVMDALEQASRERNMMVTQLLASCELFVHGSTIATNSLLEGKLARMALVTTRGFRDSLEIRRGFRADQWDHRRPYPPVLVPRSRRVGIAGRILADGSEAEAIDEAELVELANRLIHERVEAVAICLINGFLEGSHERAVATVLTRLLPDAWISLSHEVSPIMGEYERSSTVVVNAGLGPRVTGYLEVLENRLREGGLCGSLLLVQSNGGMASLEYLGKHPVQLLLSGPAAGVGALRDICRRNASERLISVEVGGTSCDVMLMENGDVATTDALEIAGYPVSVVAVEMHTVGAGGGAIARVDAGGLLQVGPTGAGAFPGPASYGRGGGEATVTDALVALGRLRERRLGTSDVVLAREPAIRVLTETVAQPLGLELEEAANGIVRILQQHVRHAVEKLSLERGHDPADYALVAGGGAGPMFAAAVARELGIGLVYVPRQSGALCALGMLSSDVQHDLRRAWLLSLDAAPGQTVLAGLQSLAAMGSDQLTKEGFATDRQRLIASLDLRYRGQIWSIKVPLERYDVWNPGAIRDAFETQYDRLFGHTQPGGEIEITSLLVTATGVVAHWAKEHLPGEPHAAAPQGETRAFVSGLGWQTVPFYEGSLLAAGAELQGPAIIEETTTTVWVGAGDSVAATHDDYLIRIEAHE